MPDKPRMLEGYRVLDFTQFVAGPTCTRVLAEMGAEVIKVELAPSGDRVRAAGLKPLLPEYKDSSQSSYYFQHNHSKLSLAVDISKPGARELIYSMIPKIDVVVENYAPGIIKKMGFGYDELRKRNPKIIMCSISALGQSGPLAYKVGYDYMGQAYAAITDGVGETDRPPAIFTMAIGDVSTGMSAAMAVGFALLHRERTGEGQYLDISILDAYFHCQEMNVQIYSASNGATNPKRSGVHHPQICPTGVFRAKEGYLIIMAFLDHQWAALCQTMGHPELTDDPRYRTNALRLEHRDEVVRAIEAWLASTASDAAAMEALRKARIPVAPVLSIDQAVNHRHLRARQTVRKISDPIFGEFDAPGFPLRFSAFPGFLPLTAPTLGQHNREVLENYLGYDAERIASLEQKGVLQSGKC
jgi:CoA:oxalate CoA-transferase